MNERCSPIYQILLRGKLDREQASWFSELSLLETSAGDTLLSGDLPDQSALIGVLFKAHNSVHPHDLGLGLLDCWNRGDICFHHPCLVEAPFAGSDSDICLPRHRSGDLFHAFISIYKPISAANRPDPACGDRQHEHPVGLACYPSFSKQDFERVISGLKKGNQWNF
jgi:hypothetical protein